MGEKVKKKGTWDARWLTIPEFADALPVNLFHKEQVQPAFEGEKTPSHGVRKLGSIMVEQDKYHTLLIRDN